MIELTRIKPAVAMYAVAALPTPPDWNEKNAATSVHNMPLSMGLP